MINLRYHIVSITAVFLALGLGLTMGSTFLDRATVESLNSQLGSLEEDLDARDRRIGELEEELETLQRTDEQLQEEGLGPLVAGELTDVPVMVLATRGTDEDLVDGALDALSASGADLDGTWWLSERFALDDDSERRDLATALGVDTDLEVRLRRTVAEGMAGMLGERLVSITGEDAEDAEGAAGGEDPAGQGGSPGTGDTGEGVDGAAGQETPAGDPELLTALRAGGFVEFQPLGDGAAARLPTALARLVLITDESADLTLEQLVLPLLEDLAADGPAPVLLASGLSEEEDPASRGRVVDAVRTDETLTDRVATLDALDRFAGELGVVFVTDALGEGGLNHYGYAETASRLLPTREPPS